jgi:hypothetical protein
MLNMNSRNVEMKRLLRTVKMHKYVHFVRKSNYMKRPLGLKSEAWNLSLKSRKLFLFCPVALEGKPEAKLTIVG